MSLKMWRENVSRQGSRRRTACNLSAKHVPTKEEEYDKDEEQSRPPPTEVEQQPRRESEMMV